VSAETIAEIDALLGRLVREQRVALPLAVESGSRAWGFPSPDSDYDCRFVYVRREDAYLSPWQPRDVIETPLIGDLDVNGWDLGKALKLMLKGNAVILEWLRSPFVYRGDAAFRAEFLALADRHASRVRLGRHYLHLGERQRQVYLADANQVAIKKLFYALRPAVVLRWMRLHAAETVAPMHFPTLMAECDPPADVAALVAELLARKAVTRELGAAPLPASIAGFIDAEFLAAREAFPAEPLAIGPEARAAAETFFRETVRRFA
jgi:predicted nucleotidyltransferase